MVIHLTHMRHAHDTCAIIPLIHVKCEEIHTRYGPDLGPVLACELKPETHDMTLSKIIWMCELNQQTYITVHMSQCMLMCSLLPDVLHLSEPDSAPCWLIVLILDMMRKVVNNHI